MKKPKIREHQMYDYSECEKYVAHKLGIKDLRDICGKFSKDHQYKETVPYQDFWHFICDNNEVNNPGQIWIFKDAQEDWQQPIIDCFLEEFGEGPYWVSW